MEEFESLVFQGLAKMSEMYLKYFQTNSPMLPVVSDMFENVVHRLLQIFIKSKIAEGAVAANELTKLISLNVQKARLVVIKFVYS